MAKKKTKKKTKKKATKKKATKKKTAKKTSAKAAPKRRGSVTVQIARLSQDAKEVTLPNGGTLQDALLAAGFFEKDLQNMLPSIRVNGKKAVLKGWLSNGDFITVSPRVQGGE